MNDAPILPDNDPVSMPSKRTLRGRTSPRGERLRAGDVLLGRYTVLSELGEGGMGVVYKCLDSVGGIEVALKCLPPELSRDEAEMEGIRENYALVARLHHSAISGLRNLEKDPDFGEYYLVMDLAEGEDLSQVLRRRHGAPMPLAEALAILRPLAAALDYAHAEKVLHRDVKPGNVKVLPAIEPGGAPRVQLLDFGLAAEVRSSLSRVSRKGHLGSSGTPAYMAPEQWEARPQGPATDQYALAVVAYEMLAGVRPFDTDDPDILRRAVLSRDPDPVPRLSRGANAALLRALAKDPAARFPSCTAFVEALGRALKTGGSALPRRIWPWLAAAAQCLNRADAALRKLVQTKAERRAREKAEAEREAKAEAKREARGKTLGKVVLSILAFMAVGIGVKMNHEHGKVQLWEGGPYWATRNIGADKPEDSGLYFWWGDTVGYRRKVGAWVASDGSSQNISFHSRNTPTDRKSRSSLQSEGWITSSGALAPEHDAAQVHWGGAWRMPTEAELSALCRNCDWTWTTRNGVHGCVVRGRGNFDASSIFLPAAGLGEGTSLDSAGSLGYCWSSVPDESDSGRACNLYFHSFFFDSVRRGAGGYYRYYGFPVRPVQGFAE